MFEMPLFAGVIDIEVRSPEQFMAAIHANIDRSAVPAS